MFGKLFGMFGGNPMYEGLTSDEKKQLKNPNGDGTIEFKLADRFFKSKEYDKAFYFANIGVEKGHRDSYYILSLCYRDGLGAEKDDAKAIKLCQDGHEKHSIECTFELGKRYFEGRGFNKDLNVAVKYLDNGMFATNTELCDALISLGRTDKRSIFILQTFAREGYKPALDRLIAVSHKNNNLMWSAYDICSDKRMKLYNPGLALQILNELEASGDLKVAMIYEKGDKDIKPNIAKAVQLYQKAAQSGDVFSASRLSRIYLGYSNLVLEDDFLKYANSAANQGNIVAQESLAYYYIGKNEEFKTGRGEGYNWALKAGQQNSGIGMLLLGMTERDSQSEARIWFSRAKQRLTEESQQGDGDATYFLAFIFMHGLDALSPIDAASHPTYKQNAVVCLKNAITLETIFKEQAKKELFKLTGETF